MDRYQSLITPGTSKVNENSNLIGEQDQNAGSFENMISAQIEKLNQGQLKSDNLVQDFVAGNTEDLHQVMIASEEARMSLELAVQIRNKTVEAYKELINMPL
ncbi:MAG: flagellar hook-basal body complex protein FliE [Clostridiaceae bacterium]